MVLISLLLSLAAWSCPAENGTAVDFKMLSGEMIQGRAPGSSDAKTQMIVLDFWASWCEPCRESLPFSAQLQKKYARKGVRFLTVSADDNEASARDFLKKMKLGLPVLWDRDRKLADQLGVTSIPTLIALNRAGQVVFRETGFTPDKRAALEKKFAQCSEPGASVE